LFEKGKEMARINVSIPDELKKEMDGVALNWSAIASAAFAAAIKEAEESEKKLAAYLSELKKTHPEITEVRMGNGKRIKI
jgi:metal-responsive CopG/Arc/MetJ family transcriptional regulator